MRNVSDLREPESPNGKEIVIPPSRADWRTWLAENSDRGEGLWVVYRKKSSELEGPLYDDLLEEALCFGWIDSRVQSVDEERRMQWFSPRRKGGLWSKLNKERIERLREQGLMTATGQKVIDEAIADGSWSQTDEVDALSIPQDLAAVFATTPAARERFESQPDSVKRLDLWAIHSAKRPATRSRRIEELIERLLGDPRT